MRMTGCPNGCARPYVAGTLFTTRSHGAALIPRYRGCVRGQGSRVLHDASRWWLLRSTNEQDLPRCVYVVILEFGRRSELSADSVTEPEILAILRPMIKHYALERLEGEHFGDFVIRAGYIAPTESGMTWWDRAGGEGKHREAAA